MGWFKERRMAKIRRWRAVRLEQYRNTYETMDVLFTEDSALFIADYTAMQIKGYEYVATEMFLGHKYRWYVRGYDRYVDPEDCTSCLHNKGERCELGNGDIILHPNSKCEDWARNPVARVCGTCAQCGTCNKENHISDGSRACKSWSEKV